MKLGFVLLSNSQRPQPSTRIAVLNMLAFLRDAGIETELVFDPERESETPDLDGLAARLIAEKFDCIYFQKVHGASVQACVRELSRAGIVSIYGVCDLVDVEMSELVDLVVVPTEFLKSIHPTHLQDKIRVVHDGIERSEIRKKESGDHYATRKNPLHAVFVTSSSLRRLPVLELLPDWLTVTVVGRYPPANDWARRFREARWAFAGMRDGHERLEYLRFLFNRRIKTERWDAKAVYVALQHADVGIIPIEPIAEPAQGTSVPVWQTKSENRLTLKMSIGLPVIATPIPAYEPVIDSGRNGFLANSRDDWLAHLELLRDPSVRSEVGSAARASVIDRYSMQEQARLLVEVIRTGV